MGRLLDHLFFGTRYDLLCLDITLCMKTLVSLTLIRTLSFWAFSLSLPLPSSLYFSLSLSRLVSLTLGRVFYIFVVRFSNGLARVSSASSVAHFEVGTSGGTFAPPCAAMRHHHGNLRPVSLFSHRTGTMKLFFPTTNIVPNKIHTRGRQSRGTFSYARNVDSSSRRVSTSIANVFPTRLMINTFICAAFISQHFRK